MIVIVIPTCREPFANLMKIQWNKTPCRLCHFTDWEKQQQWHYFAALSLVG